MHMVDFITEGPIATWNLGPLHLALTKPMVVSTGVMIVLSLGFIWLGMRPKVIPETRRQILAETIYGFVKNIVDENMGASYRAFIPFIGALILYLIGQNLAGLFGLKPATSSFSTTLGLGIVSFAIIHGYAIRSAGLGGYLRSYVKPMPFLLPITLLERIIFPISLALRLFGNILAATVIMSLIYGALLHFVKLSALVLPLPFHAYFDIFDGGIQAVIFTFLTMIQIKLIDQESRGEEE
ncbi:ATP synthase F0 sector subunit a [Clostridiaceae bacterium JG1575]|nr:ATP synthase F0 sector subunit a [Clostridiaceae bacterium JG1575]